MGILLLRILATMLVALIEIYVLTLSPFARGWMIVLFIVMLATTGVLLYYFTLSLKLFLNKPTTVDIARKDRLFGITIGVVFNALVLYVMFTQLFILIVHITESM